MHLHRYTGILVLCAVTQAAAQAPASGEQFGCQPACNPAPGVRVLSSPGNPSLRAGAQLGYTLASHGNVDDFSDFFTPRAEVKTWEGENWHVPLIGNFGKIDFKDLAGAESKLQTLVNGTSGLQAMLSPYYTFKPQAGALSRIDLYANAGVKLNRIAEAADTSKHTYIAQARLSGGTDASIDVGATHPVSLIAEVVYAHVDKSKLQAIAGRSDDYLLSFEGSVIVPVPSIENTSLLGQIIALKGAPPLWRLGTLIYTPQKK